MVALGMVPVIGKEGIEARGFGYLWCSDYLWGGPGGFGPVNTSRFLAM